MPRTLRKAFFAAVFLSAGVIGVLVSYLTKANAQVTAHSLADNPIGLPLNKPVRAPIQPPVLTRDQLVTRGHADDKLEIEALFQTYMLYHDTHNGPGVASLFTEDGVLEHLWNNGGKTIEPNAGPTGHGCYSPGRKEIIEMFEEGRGPGGTSPLPFSGHSHNQTTNVLVAVTGDTATLYGNFTTIRSNDKAAAAPVASPPNSASVSHNGEDIAYLRRTPAGWRFVHLWVLEDEQMKFGTPSCERNVVEGK